MKLLGAYVAFLFLLGLREFWRTSSEGPSHAVAPQGDARLQRWLRVWVPSYSFFAEVEPAVRARLRSTTTARGPASDLKSPASMRAIPLLWDPGATLRLQERAMIARLAEDPEGRGAGAVARALCLVWAAEQAQEAKLAEPLSLELELIDWDPGSPATARTSLGEVPLPPQGLETKRA